MNSAPSFASFPVRLPGSGIGEDLLSFIDVYGECGQRLSAHLGGRSCRNINLARALKNFGRSGKYVLAHQFAVNRGDSIHIQFCHNIRCSFFDGRVRKLRDVTVYLLDCDPGHAGVSQAASRACLADDNGQVFVVVDETPHKADRVLSFQCDILVKDLFPLKDIAALISRGFYLHNGSLRCTGCHYHKNREQLISLIHGESGKWSARIRHKFPSVFSISDIILADHEHPMCDNYWLAPEKTFFTIDDVELGHYALYSYNCPDKQYVECGLSTDESGAPVTSTEYQLGKNPEYFSCSYSDRGSDLPAISYFATTISRADFFDQGDLLSFCVRDMFASLREAFQSLTSSLLQSAPPVPSPLNWLMGGEIEECLCHLYSKTFRSAYLLERLHHSQSTYQPADIQAAVASCQAPVVPLLDRLLVLINQCGGDVAERGFASLVIDSEEPVLQTYFHYDDHGAVLAEVHGPVSGNQLSQQRYLRMAAGIKFIAALSHEVLQPLLHIFHPSQLSNEALRKIFCASELFIKRLSASETECGDF